MELSQRLKLILIGSGMNGSLLIMIKNIFKNTMRNPIIQTIVGVTLGCICAGGILLGYYLCELYLRSEIVDRINVQFDGYNTFNVVILVLVFCCANPFLEEAYWRNFVPHVVFPLLSFQVDSPSQSVQIQSKLVEGDDNQKMQELPPNLQSINDPIQAVPVPDQASTSQNNQQQQKIHLEQQGNQESLKDKTVLESEVTSKKKKPQFNMKEELLHMLFSASYASYHFLVILHISNVVGAVVGTIVVTLAGRLFLFINSHVGYIAAGFAHMGADIGIAAIAGIVFYNNREL